MAKGSMPVAEAFAATHRNYAGLIEALARRGVSEMRDLRQLPLADWWRAARRDFSSLVSVAARSGVFPKDMPNVQTMRKAVTPPTLYNGLMRQRSTTTAMALSREGVATLLLASRLTSHDMLLCINPPQLRVVVAYLAGEGVRLTGQ